MWRISTPRFCGRATLQRSLGENMGKKNTVCERTAVRSLLRHRTSGVFLRTMAAEGQANLRKPNSNLFRVANLRLDDEFANIARVRGRRAAVTAGAGTVSDRMQMEAEGETVMGVFWARFSTVAETD